MHLSFKVRVRDGGEGGESVNWFKLSSNLPPEWYASSNKERSLWLILVAYCARLENGGIIKNAGTWTAEQWFSIGLRGKDIKSDCRLWQWNNHDLQVNYYDKEGQNKYLALREAASKGGSTKRGASSSASSDAPSTATSNTPSNTQSGASSHALSQYVQYVENVENVSESEGGRELTHTLGSEKSAEIPSEKEVRDWAMGPAGVDPDFAALKWQEHSERNGWVIHGQLVDWRRRFKRFWEEDKVAWSAKRKNGAAARLPTDEEWWWEMPLESMKGALGGGALKPPEAARVREIIRARFGAEA
jgi:hypothetical protein